jgi:hypothetical protein
MNRSKQRSYAYDNRTRLKRINALVAFELRDFEKTDVRNKLNPQ